MYVPSSDSSSTKGRPAAGAGRLAAAALVALTACAAPAEDASGGRPHERRPATHTIVMEGTTFDPATLTVTLGDSVVWVNKDFFPHTATGNDAFDSGIIAAGGSWSYTPDAPGDIPYICTLHPTMRGTLQVRVRR